MFRPVPVLEKAPEQRVFSLGKILFKRAGLFRDRHFLRAFRFRQRSRCRGMFRLGRKVLGQIGCSGEESFSDCSGSGEDFLPPVSRSQGQRERWATARHCSTSSSRPGEPHFLTEPNDPAEKHRPRAPPPPAPNSSRPLKIPPEYPAQTGRRESSSRFRCSGSWPG